MKKRVCRRRLIARIGIETSPNGFQLIGVGLGVSVQVRRGCHENVLDYLPYCRRAPCEKPYLNSKAIIFRH